MCAAAPSTLAPEELLKKLEEKKAELARLKKLKADKDAADAAAAAAAAKPRPPGYIEPSAIPHWRTWVPAAGMIILGGESMGLDHGGTAVALACLLLTVFLGQQLINKLENTEARRARARPRRRADG